ncbi:UDP-N-acetylmuramate dehydrogenase [Corynebacterium pygosceleis]|uniref:UDP-N-acetylmuramate dehydrogenase n=1 Tax=Corynebacterium pygosceleis TaxID=2800406 RepID=UPI003D06A92A
MSLSSLTHRFNELHDALRGVDGIRFADDFRFSEATTLHLGGRPVGAVHCATTSALAAAVTRADALDLPLLVVGGGSNLVVADGDLPFVAVIADCADVSVDSARGVLRADAGAVWDDVVASSVDAGLGGVECLSGIPGSAGATPVQNVGAYGAEIADVLTRVLLLDRTTGNVDWVPASALDLGYRTSNLKHTDRGVILAIELRLRTDGMSAPLRFGELARRLGVNAADAGNTRGALRRPAAAVRDAVLELRRGKGMVHDPADHDTWSAGSFFTNPVITDTDATSVRAAVAGLHGDTVAEAMPCYPAGEGRSKLSAAWLIERAGFVRGYPGPEAPARLSTRHTLALTNRGAATTGDLVELAREVRAGVRQAFGVTLHPEPVWVGVDIDG